MIKLKLSEYSFPLGKSKKVVKKIVLHLSLKFHFEKIILFPFFTLPHSWLWDFNYCLLTHSGFCGVYQQVDLHKSVLSLGYIHCWAYILLGIYHFQNPCYSIALYVLQRFIQDFSILDYFCLCDYFIEQFIEIYLSRIISQQLYSHTDLLLVSIWHQSL